eukprot:gnl/TRDRNA2_/TRDRNA2_177628_c0_seq1.p1 gnl/TRDRNA2_/TRDRNA2_177628_c0~~gnl/TRDRNA2_/TRDRNA2_177628_c0_seq1.p1  ORF type:complete len:246 (+),score=54.84 gnl/TRDRNA2_/TRDRNA2_177628_c0_seq1:126-863(+)
MTSSAGASPKMGKSASTGSLAKTGGSIVSRDIGVGAAGVEPPKLPKYLNVKALTKRRKLSNSTGNLHGYMAEDYSQLNWPLPKMFGNEKYGYSLIDIEDPRYQKECAGHSKKLVRLQYDIQIIDLEWRKTYKALLDAEHRMHTCPTDKTKQILKKEIDSTMKYLLELQEQKDMYDTTIKEVYSKCDAIKASIRQENDLDDVRMMMEKHTRDRISKDSAFWNTKFNTRSPNNTSKSRLIALDRFDG